MTRIAARNIAHAANVIFLHQRRSQINLICVTLSVHHHRMRARRWLVTHIENLIPRAQIILRLAMAAQTPLHLQGFLLVHQRHLVHRAVAGVTSHSLCHMNAVIEKNEVGKLVHSRPLQRLARSVAGSDRLQQLGIGPDLRVAVHAGLGGRNTGKTRSLHRSMAVAAVDT